MTAGHEQSSDQPPPAPPAPRFSRARDVGEASDDYLASQIARHDDEIEEMRRLMSTHISAAIEEGIMRAVSNPALWASATTAIQQQAKQRAGGWLLGGVSALASKAGWVFVACVAVYTMGGWAAVVGLIKAWLAGGKP